MIDSTEQQARDKRWELLITLQKIAEDDKLNLITLYCLAATMTNNQLEEFVEDTLTKK